MSFSLKIFLIFIIVGASAFAQRLRLTTESSITGRVVEGQNEVPLAYANVILYTINGSSQVAGLTTDEEGKFAFSEIKTGDYFLEISFIGFETIKIPVFSVENHRF